VQKHTGGITGTEMDSHGKTRPLIDSVNGSFFRGLLVALSMSLTFWALAIAGVWITLKP